jgi:hypothetical protein
VRASERERGGWSDDLGWKRGDGSERMEIIGDGDRRNRRSAVTATHPGGDLEGGSGAGAGDRMRDARAEERSRSRKARRVAGDEGRSDQFGRRRDEGSSRAYRQGVVSRKRRRTPGLVQGKESEQHGIFIRTRTNALHCLLEWVRRCAGLAKGARSLESQ